MIIKKLPYNIICDICGNINSDLSECYTVFSWRKNSGWDKTNEKLNLEDREDYLNPDFHICPKCSTKVFNFLCKIRRINDKNRKNKC